MSYRALLESIKSGDARTAAETLADDELLCTEIGEPSALLLALYQGFVELAKTIALRRSVLTVFEAAAMGDIPALERSLLEHPDAPHVFAADGFTALHLACFFGHTHAAGLLLQAHANPNARAGNATLICPLHSAAASGSVTICQMLLHAGAAPNATQQGGFTALHAAAFQGNARLADLLLARGADAGLVAADGRSAHVLARDNGFLSLADRLGRLA
jgi:ankyrin repeat protein